jgi:hypothetical protein
MSKRFIPILADAKTASALLCMKVGEFRALVETGHLPGPCHVGDFERWHVADLERIATGAAIEGQGEIAW